jgi:hypothetical protein
MHGIIEEAYEPPKGRHSPQNPETDGSEAAAAFGREFAKVFRTTPPPEPPEGMRLSDLEGQEKVRVESLMLGDGAVLGGRERDLSAIFWENPMMEPACMAKSPDPMAVTMPDADDSRAHGHYFKNVGHLDVVDVYRVLDLFEVTDQALGHAVKKLLVAGGRGTKNVHRDVQDAIDTLLRWQEMQRENVALPRIAGASN